jgi:hypothetical protein
MSAFAPVLANVRILLVGLRQGAVADHTKEKTLTRSAHELAVLMDLT